MRFSPWTKGHTLWQPHKGHLLPWSHSGMCSNHSSPLPSPQVSFCLRTFTLAHLSTKNVRTPTPRVGSFYSPIPASAQKSLPQKATIYRKLLCSHLCLIFWIIYFIVFINIWNYLHYFYVIVYCLSPPVESKLRRARIVFLTIQCQKLYIQFLEQCLMHSSH